MFTHFPQLIRMAKSKIPNLNYDKFDSRWNHESARNKHWLSALIASIHIEKMPSEAQLEITVTKIQLFISFAAFTSANNPINKRIQTI